MDLTSSDIRLSANSFNKDIIDLAFKHFGNHFEDYHLIENGHFECNINTFLAAALGFPIHKSAGITYYENDFSLYLLEKPQQKDQIKLLDNFIQRTGSVLILRGTPSLRAIDSLKNTQESLHSFEVAFINKAKEIKHLQLDNADNIHSQEILAALKKQKYSDDFKEPSFFQLPAPKLDLQKDADLAELQNTEHLIEVDEIGIKLTAPSRETIIQNLKETYAEIDQSDTEYLLDSKPLTPAYNDQLYHCVSYYIAANEARLRTERQYQINPLPDNQAICENSITETLGFNSYAGERLKAFQKQRLWLIRDYSTSMVLPKMAKHLSNLDEYKDIFEWAEIALQKGITICPELIHALNNGLAKLEMKTSFNKDNFQAEHPELRSLISQRHERGNLKNPPKLDEIADSNTLEKIPAAELRMRFAAVIIRTMLNDNSQLIVTSKSLAEKMLEVAKDLGESDRLPLSKHGRLDNGLLEVESLSSQLRSSKGFIFSKKPGIPPQRKKTN